MCVCVRFVISVELASYPSICQWITYDGQSDPIHHLFGGRMGQWSDLGSEQRNLGSDTAPATLMVVTCELEDKITDELNF